MYSAHERAVRYFKWRWSSPERAWGVVENYSSAIEQARQEMLRVQLHSTRATTNSVGELDAVTEEKGHVHHGGL